jgi:hypothetical protein
VKLRSARRPADQYLGRHHRTARFRGLRLVATLGLILASLAGIVAVQFPGAEGAYIAKITNSTNTAATNPYFTCTAAVSNTTVGRATFAYPFGEASAAAAAVSGAVDSSGNNYTGAYGGGGFTYGVDNPVCDRDNKTAVTFNGTSSYVTTPNTLTNAAVTAPNVFSLEVWFKTTAAQGKLIGFGSSRTGSSGTYDRHLYIDSNGLLEFGVYPNTAVTIASTKAVTDGNWHYAVATLSSTGMALYLDGSLVATNANTAAQTNTGYWRIGYDNLAAWTATPSSYYFKGSMAWAAEYNYALTATQVAQHYAAGS